MTRDEAVLHIVQELSDYRLSWEAEMLSRGVDPDEVALNVERENLLDYEALSRVFDAEELQLAVERAG